MQGIRFFGWVTGNGWRAVWGWGREGVWRIEANWPPRKEAPDHWAGYVVVHEHWKLLVSSDSSHAELYDLQKDPLEKEDLSQSQPKVVAELRRKLDDWKATLPAHPAGDVFSKERENLKSPN
mgnify:CR=1 FL=1